MANGNLYDLFVTRVPAEPGAVFLEVPGGQGLTYQALDPAVSRYANLITSLGAKPGDRVVAQVEKSVEAVLLYLACLKAGVIYIPLNTGYTEGELEYFLRDAGPRLVVSDPAREEMLGALAAKCGVPHLMTLDAAGGGTFAAAAAGHSADFRSAPVASDDVAAILYTSGTTGRPKGAMLTHGNLASNALVLHEFWQWRPGDVLLHALPVFHVHGLFIALHCALLNGSRVIFLPKFDRDAILDHLPQATVLMGVPTFYVRLLDSPRLDPDLCRNMRLFISGSAPLLAETWEAFADRTGHRILERYGMTETGMITSNPYDGERVPGTVGYALPGIAVRITGEDGRPVGAQEVGILEVKGPNVFKGYWQMPEKTTEDFTADGWFRTGDMAMAAEDGRVTLVGRAKDLVISGGFNIYPKEIEEVMDAFPGVVETAVIGVPHPDFGEAVVAVVVPEAGAEIDLAALQDYLQDKLARFKQPKHMALVGELPRNVMGKVQKNLLRARYGGLFSGKAGAGAG